MTSSIYKYIVLPDGVIVSAPVVKWLSAAVDPADNVVAYAVVDTDHRAPNVEYRVFPIITGGDADEVDFRGTNDNELLATQFLGTVKITRVYMAHVFVRRVSTTVTAIKEKA